MLRKNNAISNASLKDVLKACPFTTLSTTRYTYEAWMRCYPDSNREEYEERQHPHNMMEYLASVYIDCEDVLREHPDMDIKLVLLDDDYFKWLGGREDTPKNRASYYPPTEEERIAKLAKNKLNISEWAYSLPVCGITKKPQASAIIETSTADALARYLKETISDEDVSVFVSQYILKSDDYYNNEKRFFSMADAWFDNKNRVKMGRFASLSFKSTSTVTVLHIPVIIRETNKTGCIKAGELLAYMGKDAGDTWNTEDYLKKQWYPDLIELGQSGNSPAKETYECADGFIAKEHLCDTEAGKLLAKEFERIFPGDMMEGLPTYLLNISDIPEYYYQLMDSVEAAMQSSGIQTVWR